MGDERDAISLNYATPQPRRSRRWLVVLVIAMSVLAVLTVAGVLLGWVAIG